MDDQSAILLVEDNVDDADLVRHAFRKAGIRNPVILVTDGDMATDYLREQGDFADRLRFPAPRLILMDLKLPRRSGLEVLSILRQTAAVRSCPVIVLSSSNLPDDIRTAYNAGANAYLVKPIGGDALIDMVRAIDAFWIGLNRAPLG